MTAGLETWVNDKVTFPEARATNIEEILSYHRRLPEYQESPLHDCPELAERLGVHRVWIKDESSRLGLPSFKILGASWAVYRVLCQRLRAEPYWADVHELAAAVASLKPLTLLAATDGNHGRAVARMAAFLGLDCQIFVPAGTTAARIAGIRSEGASVVTVEGDYDDAVACSVAAQRERALVVSDTSWPGYEAVPTWVSQGYFTIFEEVDRRLAVAGAGRPSTVVIPLGVGALASAAIQHFRRPGAASAPYIVGVEPLGAACVLRSLQAGQRVVIPGPHRSIMAGLNCGTPSEVAWPFLQGGLDAAVAVDDDWTRDAMRALAAVGVEAGETGAAALAGAQAIADRAPSRVRQRSGLDPAAEVLLLVTEGPTDPVGFEAVVGRAPKQAPSSPPATAPS